MYQMICSGSINGRQLTYENTKNYLEYLGHTKYSDYIPRIINKINGISSPILGDINESKIIMMFENMQTALNDVCYSRGGTNTLLTYSYIFYKLIQILGLYRFERYLPREWNNIYQCDMMWKDICKKMQWRFVNTI